jgi:hypothetical protein
MNASLRQSLTDVRVPPASDLEAGGAVTGKLNYLVPPLGRNAVHVVPLGGGEARRTAEYTATAVAIRDARLSGRSPTLDGGGFALQRQNSRVVDFFDDEEIRAVYYPEMQRLVRKATGAREVVVFDHNVRIDGGAHVPNSRVPVRIVHNDYTEKSGPQRVRDLIGGERAESLLENRVAIVNAWRSIAGVVRTAPLGLIHARSVRTSDLVSTDLIYPDRVGEIYEVAGNPAHRWYYFSEMNRDEVLLIKGYDSRIDVARFTPHSAFNHPDTSKDAPPRTSIEIRSLVFF